MLWEVYQQKKVSGAERTAERAEMKADRFADEITQLKRHVDRLTLACQAMWELLRDNSDLSEDQLKEKIMEVDMRDGKADGRIGTQICQCPKCGNNTNSTRHVCVMCGALLDKQHIFEA